MRRAKPPPLVALAPDVVSKLSVLAQMALPLETGGILLGWYQLDDIHVADAIVVPDPSATATSYRRGRVEGNEVLAAYMMDHPEDTPVGYVGEWHSHPGSAGPSPLDMLSFLNITQSANQPLAQVVMTLQHDGWQLVVCMSRFKKRFGRRRRG